MIDDDGLCGVIYHFSTADCQLRCKYEFGHGGRHSWDREEQAGQLSFPYDSGVFNHAERAKEKQTSRDQDAEDLRTGKKTREQLRAESGKFAFPNVKIGFSKSKPVK